jgi:hypothetical protein
MGCLTRYALPNLPKLARIYYILLILSKSYITHTKRRYGGVTVKKSPIYVRKNIFEFGYIRGEVAQITAGSLVLLLTTLS